MPVDLTTFDLDTLDLAALTREAERLGYVRTGNNITPGINAALWRALRAGGSRD